MEAVAGSFTVEAGGLIELIRSTTEMEPSREPRSEAIPPHTRIHLRIRTCNTITMGVTEAAESPSEKEEEHFPWQEMLKLRMK